VDALEWVGVAAQPLRVKDMGNMQGHHTLDGNEFRESCSWADDQHAVENILVFRESSFDSWSVSFT
jgi:hypothetical protein